MDLASLKGDRSKCLLLEKRNHACYQLITNRQYLDGETWKAENEGETPSDAKIKRWRFGNVDSNKKKKTILIVGETGTGKTTLINSIVTHLIGVKYNDKMWFQITGEEQKSQAKSQTACVTAYELYIDANPMSLTIIDTPGFGDTEGIEEDKKIPRHLFKLFTSFEGVHTINTIGLVVKASQNRLTPSQQYIFNEVVSLFGRNVEKSIVILFTHSDGTVPEDGLNAIKEANIPCRKDEHGEPVYFSFNNTLLKPSKTPIAEKQWAKLLRKFEEFWSDREDNMEVFLQSLNTAEEVSLRMTEEVLKTRQTLEACIINLQQRIAKTEEEQNKLKQIEYAVRMNKEKLDNNQNFEFEVDEIIQQLKPIKEVMKSCKEMAEKLRKEYEEEYGKGVDMQARIEEKLELFKIQQAKQVDEAYEKIMKLQEIALKKDPPLVLMHLDLLISKLRDCGKQEEASKLEEIQRKAPPVSTGVKALYKTLVSRVWRS